LVRSFRREAGFCGFSVSEATPERTAFVRFRGELVRRGLDGKLFLAVVRQLEGQGLVVRTGTLVDATVIRAASAEDGEAGWEAGWNVYSGAGPVKGYKAHVATDEAGGIVRKVRVTPANEHDAGSLARGAIRGAIRGGSTRTRPMTAVRSATRSAAAAAARLSSARSTGARGRR
jgi:IS5 family transposase